ncbi:MAG: tRNA pseudouridine(55) synthase TruB [Phormidesmis sp.]
MVDFSGFINLNKPKQWSSHDCVGRVRRLLNTKKVGHGGTLDPLATGVLPIAVGRATRLIQYLPARKAYRAVVRFGVTTSTDDLEGEVLTQQSAAHLQRSDIEALLPKFTGALSQTPPMFSAIQVGGKRLYDLARKGQQIEVPIRTVTIHQLHIAEWHAQTAAPELVLDIHCGPGTYIRSLARDMGEAVGTGATLAGLTRTHSNGFELKESLTLEALEAAITHNTFTPMPAGKAVQHLAMLSLTPPLAKRWCMGQKLAISEPGITPPPNTNKLTSQHSKDQMPADDVPHNSSPMPLRMMCADTFLGIGEIRTSDYGDSEGSTHHILAPKMVFTPY